jgi:hypothetical protein
MEFPMEEGLDRALFRDEFPRSGRYDARWVIENQMGLNPFWLTECGCEKMSPSPGECVLDLSRSREAMRGDHLVGGGTDGRQAISRRVV